LTDQGNDHNHSYRAGPSARNGIRAKAASVNDACGFFHALASARRVIQRFAPPLSRGLMASMKRRFQYSLRTLLVALTVVSVVVGISVQRARRQRDAVDAIRTKRGVMVQYDYEDEHSRSKNRSGTAAQPFNARLLGIDMVADVVGVMVMGWRGSDAPFDDSDMALVSAFSKLKYLRLDGTKVTDHGLGSLVDLRHLKSVYLRGSPVTDAGVKYIAQLPELSALILDCPNAINEAAFAMLAQSPSLTFLDLRDTPITDSDLLELARSNTLKEIHLSGRQLSTNGQSAFERINTRCKLKVK
jgi:hypothetical protein